MDNFCNCNYQVKTPIYNLWIYNLWIIAIANLKQELNAVILAHYYQESNIQDIADYISESLGLSQKAAETDG